MREVTSYTELSTLAKCEQMWAYRYRDHAEQGDRAVYFRKGTMLHELFHAWWIGGDAQARAERALEEFEQRADFDDIALLEEVDWLYHRYTQHYGEMRAAGNLRVVETELKITNPLPNSDVSVVTYVDQLVWLKGIERREDGLYVVERKTMADWQRLETLDVDPQIGIALWQLRNAGWPVKGVVYDAIRTYRWKPEKPTQKALIEAELGSNPAFAGEYVTQRERTEWAKFTLESHPGVERAIEDSFQWLYTDRNAQQIAPLVDDMRTAVRRRAVLGAGEVPMRNIGTTCRTCSFRGECHGDLIFPELIEMRYEQR